VTGEISFEAAQTELERIVDRLESGQAELDEAIALWERGEELYRVCRKKLDTAEGRIEELARRVEDTRGGDEPSPFTDDPSSA
jgi:exodeoxyribonuclease VII small subunit